MVSRVVLVLAALAATAAAKRPLDQFAGGANSVVESGSIDNMLADGQNLSGEHVVCMPVSEGEEPQGDERSEHDYFECMLDPACAETMEMECMSVDAQTAQDMAESFSLMVQLLTMDGETDDIPDAAPSPPSARLAVLQNNKDIICDFLNVTSANLDAQGFNIIYDRICTSNEGSADARLLFGQNAQLCTFLANNQGLPGYSLFYNKLCANTTTRGFGFVQQWQQNNQESICEFLNNNAANLPTQILNIALDRNNCNSDAEAAAARLLILNTNALCSFLASNTNLPFSTQLSSKWCGTGRRRRDAQEKEEEERKLLVVNTAALCSFLTSNPNLPFSTQLNNKYCSGRKRRSESRLFISTTDLCTYLANNQGAPAWTYLNNRYCSTNATARSDSRAFVSASSFCTYLANHPDHPAHTYLTENYCSNVTTSRSKLAFLQQNKEIICDYLSANSDSFDGTTFATFMSTHCSAETSTADARLLLLNTDALCNFLASSQGLPGYTFFNNKYCTATTTARSLIQSRLFFHGNNLQTVCDKISTNATGAFNGPFAASFLDRWCTAGTSRFFGHGFGAFRPVRPFRSLCTTWNNYMDDNSLTAANFTAGSGFEDYFINFCSTNLLANRAAPEASATAVEARTFGNSQLRTLCVNWRSFMTTSSLTSIGLPNGSYEQFFDQYCSRNFLIVRFFASKPVRSLCRSWTSFLASNSIATTTFDATSFEAFFESYCTTNNLGRLLFSLNTSSSVSALCTSFTTFMSTNGLTSTSFATGSYEAFFNDYCTTNNLGR